MDVMEAIKSRHSSRNYLSKEIEEGKIALLLEALRLAPGARVEQNFKVMLVRDESLREKLAVDSQNQTFIAEAPLVMVMCYNNERIMLCGEPVRPIDCSIALTYVLLEAEELGLSTCWIGAFESEKVRKTLNIPRDYKIFALLPIGYTETEGRPTRRKNIEELVLYDKWEEA